MDGSFLLLIVFAIPLLICALLIDRIISQDQEYKKGNQILSRLKHDCYGENFLNEVSDYLDK